MNVPDLMNLLASADCGSNALFGYIDPGTGSYVFQMLAAGALTVLMTMRNVRCYVAAKFNALLGRKTAPQPTPPTDSGSGEGVSR